MVMLKIPALLMTDEFELLCKRVYSETLLPQNVMHVMATTHQSILGDMNVTIPLS